MRKIFENYNQFTTKLIIEEKELEKHSYSIEDVQNKIDSMSRSGETIIVSTDDVKYNKGQKEFEVNESNLKVKDITKVDNIILHNPKTDKAVWFLNRGELYSSKDYTFIASQFKLWDKPQPRRDNFRVVVYYKKPRKMSHYDRMNLGLEGSLD